MDTYRDFTPVLINPKPNGRLKKTLCYLLGHTSIDVNKEVRYVERGRFADVLVSYQACTRCGSRYWHDVSIVRIGDIAPRGAF